MTSRLALLALPMLVLSACGGAGGDGASGAVTVVSGATPTPSPAPTPAPTPTPTPAPTQSATGVPSASYGTACAGYAASQNAYAVSANIRLTRVFRAPVTPGSFHYSIVDIAVDNFSQGLRFVFDAANQMARTVDFDLIDPVYAFGKADLVPTANGRLSYASGTKRLDLRCSDLGAVSFQDYSSDLENPDPAAETTWFRAQMTGLATPSQSVLATGTYATTATMRAFRTDERVPARRTETIASIEPGSIAFDLATRRLTGTIRMGGVEPVTLTFDMAASNSTRFNGTVASSDGAKGEIIGGFYGANAEEIGFVTSFERFGIHYVLSGSGRR